MRTSIRRLATAGRQSSIARYMAIPIGGFALAAMIAACSDSANGRDMSGGAPSATADGTTWAPSAAQARAGRTQQLANHIPARALSAKLVGPMAADETLNLVIALEPKDVAAIHAAAARVSDPDSPEYRRYMTPEEFGEQFGAPAADYQKLIDWAKAKKLTVTPHSNRITAEVQGSVADIESALNVHMHYRLREDGTQFHAADSEPSLDLDVPVRHISNLENFVAPKTAAGGSGPGGSIQGANFRNAYASCTSLKGEGQTIGIVMLFGGFLQSDINGYFAAQSLPPPRPVQMVPPSTPSGSTNDPELSLDTQMTLSMAPGAQIVGFTGGLTTILTNMAQRPDIKQLSSSFFANLDDTGKNALAQIALQGQSFLQATGDDGSLVLGYFTNFNDARLQPTVTNVGGTSLSMLSNGSSYGTESAWSGSSGAVLVFGSTSEFIFTPDEGSSGVSIPSYQVGLATTANQASHRWRNMPDVSAEGAFADIQFNGSHIQVGGTSVSAPLWAGFTALANQRAASLGQPSVGAANPALYRLARSAYAASFNDITTGSAPGRGNQDYSAVTGYDLVTGLGSPKCALIESLANSHRGNDILWRSTTTGETSIWRMQDGVRASDASLSFADSDWVIQGTGDFNADGTGDILWRQTSTGLVSIWIVKNGVVSDHKNPGSAPADWQIQGTGDFNGDGTTDILWRQTSTGVVGVWEMQNGATFAQPTTGTGGLDWQIQGTGDFNGDGTTDVLWRQPSSGRVSIWEIRNAVLSTSTLPGSAPADWQIKGTGDFDGDGTTDILWRQTSTGAVGIWQMQNGGAIQMPTLSSPVADWVIQGTGDFDADGNSDILWRQTSTGAVSIWRMAGDAQVGTFNPGSAGSNWVIRGTVVD